MDIDNNTRAIHPVVAGQIPRPPKKCSGHLYTVRVNDTLLSISRKFHVSTEHILAANPQIINPNIIFVNQVICIPAAAVVPKPTPTPDHVCNLRVLSLRFLTEARQPLQVVGGSVQLNARVIVRATFNQTVFRAFFFLEPTGTETCELARLIGVDCPSTSTAEILWQVPQGTLGRVFVVACINSCCAKSGETLVVRNNNQ